MQPSAIRLTFNPVRPRRVYSTAGPFLVAGTSLALSPAPHHSTGALRLDGAPGVAFEDIGAPARGAVSLEGPPAQPARTPATWWEACRPRASSAADPPRQLRVVDHEPVG